MSLETASDTTTNHELLQNTTVDIGNAAQYISGQHSLLPRMTVDAGGLLDAASLYLPGTNSTLPSTDQYPSAELLPTHDLTEEDRRLAAALVAVQFVQQQKHQQQLLINDNANQDTVSTLPGIAQLTGSIKTTMSGISESQPLIISAIDRPAMAAMVSSYIQAVDADANSVLYTNSNSNVQTTTESSLSAPLSIYKETNLSQSPRRKKHGSISSTNSTGSHIQNNQSPNFKQRNNISPVVKLEQLDIKSEEEGVCEGSDEGVLDSDYDDRIGNRSSKKSLPHKKRISRKLKHQKKSSSSTKNIHAKCYKCYKCGEQFTSQSDFAAHRNNHNVISEVTFCCQICSEISVTQFSFFEHLKQHYEPNCIKTNENTRQNSKIASLKGIELVNKEQLLNENQIVVTLPPAVYACNECGRTFRRQKTYETHVRDVHSKLEIEEFSEPEDLMDGIRVVVEAQEQSTEDDFNSDPLEHQIETNSTEELQHDALGQLPSANLPSHSILMTDSKSWYRGDELNETEADLQELDEQQFKGTGTLPYICNLCGALFPFKTHLLRHQTQCYMVNKDGLPADMQNLTTQQLQMEFGDVENGEEKRKRNRKKILKNTNGSLTCPSCGRGFNHRNSLVYHMRSHSGERPHQCEVCGKSFFATSALKVHMRLHSGDKPYKCEFCSRYFRQWGDLKYHCISIHSDQKQYQCEYCGKDFARKYSLIVHRRIHTGEKNYVCEFCNKTFRASSYLQNHRRIHTGEKPHTCSVCGKPFRVRSDMKRHLSTHSRDRHASKLIPPTTPTLDTDYTDSKGAVNTEKSNFPVKEIIEQEDSGSATQENESVDNKEEIDEGSVPKTENVTTTLHYAPDPLAVRDGSNTLYVWPIYMN